MTSPFLNMFPNSYGNPFVEGSSPQSSQDRTTDPRSKSLPEFEVRADNIDVEPYSLPEFVSWVRSAGLQKTNRFFVRFSPPRKFADTKLAGTRQMKDYLLACEEINVPPRTIQTRTLRLNGLNERRANTIDYGSDLTLTFLVDNTNLIQGFFEHWMNMQVDQETREVGEYDDYTTDVHLWFLRPFTPNETYNALARQQSPLNQFVRSAADRLTSLAAAEVGRFKNRLRDAFESKKREVVNSNIGLYTRLKSVLPLDLLSQKTDSPSDYAMYRISFKEAFPTQITRSVLNQGGTDVMRITVQFAFKEYHTDATAIMKSTPDENRIFNFIKRTGIPTSASGIARSIINLL